MALKRAGLVVILPQRHFFRSRDIYWGSHHMQDTAHPNVQPLLSFSLVCRRAYHLLPYPNPQKDEVWGENYPPQSSSLSLIVSTFTSVFTSFIKFLPSDSSPTSSDDSQSSVIEVHPYLTAFTVSSNLLVASAIVLPCSSNCSKRESKLLAMLLLLLCNTRTE